MNNYDPNYVDSKTFALIGQKAIILNTQNKILVLQRSEKSGAGGKWSLAGGALEFGEDPYEGMIREITEETEQVISCLQPFAIRSYTEEKNFIVIIGYRCNTKNEKVILNWEHDNYKWVTIEEALLMDLGSDGRYFIEEFKKFASRI